ncbi:MAG: YqgE/AlgH family protein [Planctomycetota bacterium]
MSNPMLAGHLLAAVPNLQDPNFFRSVVLIFQHDPEGAAGLILNRQLPISLAEVAKEAMQLEGEFEQALFWGGPVEGPLMALHDSLALAEMQVLPGVFFSMQRQNIQALLERKNAVLRIFTGYSGWGSQQLQDELKAGGWLSLPGSEELVFGDPELLWRQVCERVGTDIILPNRRNSIPPMPPEWN